MPTGAISSFGSVLVDFSHDSKEGGQVLRQWWGAPIFVIVTGFLAALPYMVIAAIVYVSFVDDIEQRKRLSADLWSTIDQWGWLLYLLFGVYLFVIWFGPAIRRSKKIAWTGAILLLAPVAIPMYWYKYLLRGLDCKQP